MAEREPVERVVGREPVKRVAGRAVKVRERRSSWREREQYMEKKVHVGESVQNTK